MKFRKELLLDLPNELESERIVLRKYDFGHGKDILALLNRNDNREFLKEYVDEATEVYTLDEAEIRARELRGYWESRIRFVMGVWLKETNTIIGNIWIEPKNWHLSIFELGYYLDKGFVGKGLASEATKRAIRFLFTELGAQKIVILTHDTNSASYKLAERLGFTKEGHLRDHCLVTTKKTGLLQYGLLKEEYLRNSIYSSKE